MIDHRSVASAFVLSLVVAGTLGPPAGAQPADERQLDARLRHLPGRGAEPARARDGGPSVSSEEIMSLVRPRIVGGAAGRRRPRTRSRSRCSWPRSRTTPARSSAAARWCARTWSSPPPIAATSSPRRQVQVLTGTRRLDGTGDRRNVARIAIHPAWNSGTFDNDVAVWELTSDAAGVPLATLATEDGPVGADLLVTGWGTLTEGGAQPDRPARRHRAAGRHRQLQRRQFLQRPDPAQHDLRRARRRRRGQLPGRLGRPADPRRRQRHPDRDRELGQRLRPAEPLRRLHPGVEPGDPQLHRGRDRQRRARPGAAGSSSTARSWRRPTA